MNPKERVLAALEHQKPDRLPKSDSFWEDTLIRWYAEGMPTNIPPHLYFDFDILPLHLDASPRFEPELLAEDANHRTFRDRFGYVVKKLKNKSRTLDYRSYPAPDVESWENVKPKFELQPEKSARLDTDAFVFRLKPEPTVAEAHVKIESQCNGHYKLANAYGPHEATWRLHGFTQTLIDLVENPDFIRDIAETYIRHLMQVIQRTLADGLRFDGFFMVDDLAGTRGMLFSPQIWRSIYRPLVEQLGTFLRENHLHFWMHSCGNCSAVFDDLIDCGVQVMNPLEVKSGLDVVELKRRFGKRLCFFGNFDVRNMADSEKAIATELHRKVPAFKNGGLIYHSDHSIPPEVSFNRYQYVQQMLERQDCNL